MQTVPRVRSDGAAAIGKVLDLAEFVAESDGGVTAAEISDDWGFPVRPSIGSFPRWSAEATWSVGRTVACI